jgi:broad specificity phosphatase PhoE
VALRVRSAIDSLAERYTDRDVVVVAHEVVILLFRYVLEDLTEADVLAIGRDTPMANCAITTFTRDPSNAGLTLTSYAETLPVEELGADVTVESDAPIAPR